MSNECCICLEKIDEGVIDVWLCTTCRIEVHKSCKNAWDISNEGNNTCPHCRNEVEEPSSSFNTIDNMELAIFEPFNNLEDIQTQNRSTSIIYISWCCKLVIITTMSAIITGIMFGFIFIFFRDFIYRYDNYNYTMLR